MPIQKKIRSIRAAIKKLSMRNNNNPRKPTLVNNGVVDDVRGREHNDRPQKRQKASAEESLSTLVEMGLSNYSCNDYDTAVECFSQALRQVDLDLSLREHITFKEAQSGSGKDEAKNGDSATEITRKATPRSSPVVTSPLTTRDYAESSNNTIIYDEGMRVYDSLLEIEENTEAECAAVLCYNLAQSYLNRGLYSEARTWFHKSLNRFMILDGGLVNNKSTSRIVQNLHSLAYCLYRLGNEDEAQKYYERAVKLVSESNMGKIHLAASVNCMGVILFNQQQPCNTDLAMEMFRRSYDLYKSCDDKEINMAAIATVLNNIGRVHYMRSEFVEALKIYKDCVQLRRDILGDQSIDVAATAYNLGQTCYQLGDMDESLKYYKEFLNIAISHAGPASKDIALVYKGIGEVYQSKSDYKMALQYFEKSLDAQRSCCKGHPNADIAALLNRMGNLCYEMKHYQTAMTHYQEGLKVEKAILAPDHPHIIITMTNIGHIYKQLNDYPSALKAYKNACSRQRNRFGNSSFVLAETSSSIGLMQYHLRDYEASFDSYQEALRIRRQHLGGDEHSEIASTLNSIGLVLFKQDVFELAKNCFTESLRIRTKLLGKNHRDVAILWYNIATIHFETGEDELAIQMYKETLRVERHALGEDHPDVVLTLQHLGQVHQQLGFTEKAIGFFHEALAIERRRTEPVQRSISRILNLLGNVHLQLGETKEMMECYIEASRIYESDRTSGETLVIGGYNFYGISKTNPPSAPVA